MGEWDLLEFWAGLWPNPYPPIMGKRLIPILIPIGWDRDKYLIQIGL